MALGARRRSVLALVARQGLLLLAVGAAAGLGGAIALGRVMQSFLFGVSATDAQALAGVFAVLAAVAVLATVLPARRAAQIDPAAALRMD
jgi:ABC-type antimicrobial peptide transport system permease subunit